MDAVLFWSSLWNGLLSDAYWYCFSFFLISICAEEVLAPHRKWRNRDDRIAYGQRADSPANIRLDKHPLPLLSANRKLANT